MKQKKGFTLVELLAVIVILAVILVIAVPQIVNTIKASRLGAIESSAKLIASNADEYYLAQQTLDPNYTGSGVTCEDVSKLSNDYESCSITYNNGKATVRLIGKNKFSGIICIGTKEDIACEQDESLLYTVTFDSSGGTTPSFLSKKVYVGNTYGNLPSTSKEGYTFLGWVKNSLPSQYQEVEYIESTGTQYINTMIYPKSTTKLEADFQFTEIKGQLNGWGSSYSQETFMWGIESGYFFSRVNSNWSGINITTADTNRHTISLESGKQSFDGELYGNTTIGNTATSNQYLYIFVYHAEWANGPEGGAKMKLYKLKMWDDGTLVRDMIPCYRKSDNVIGLYDMVSNTFFTNQGTGTFNKGDDVDKFVTPSTQVITNDDHTLYAVWGHNPVVTFDANGGTVSPASKTITYNSNYGKLPVPTKEGYTFLGWAKNSLPSQYQEVEYIESTGTQYINTMIYPKSTTKLEADFQFTEIKDQLNGWGSSGSQETFMWGMSSKYFFSRVNSNWSGINITTSDINRHTISLESGKQSFDGELYGNTTIGNTATSNQYLYIFAYHAEWTDGPDGGAKMKLYKLKMWDDRTLVRDMIPCYRKSDNVIGLYDMVNNTFFTNQGTGAFNKGDDVYKFVTPSTQVTTNENHTLYAIWEPSS